MNTTDPQGDLLRPRPAAPLASAEEFQRRTLQLQNLVNVALLSIVVMSLFICAFIGKQWRMVRAQVEDQRPTVQRMKADYRRTTEPLIRSFTASLQTFAAQNRDFQPILDRYRDPLRIYLAPATPGLTPGPAPK